MGQLDSIIFGKKKFSDILEEIYSFKLPFGVDRISGSSPTFPMSIILFNERLISYCSLDELYGK